MLTNARKTLHPGKILAGFIFGSNRLYKWVDDNPLIELHPTEYVNDPFVIAQNERQVAINSVIEVDLTGQVCADRIGPKLYSGVGGQLDFVHGASRSKGAVPIIALPSTTILRNGQMISRIVCMLNQGAGVVTTRNHVRYIVTEYGIADLYGKTIRQRAQSLINIAHPQFRDELTALKAQADQLAQEKERAVASVKNTYDSLLAALKQEIKQGEIQITQLKDKLTVNMVDKILFDSGSAVIKKNGKKVLDRVADILKNVKGQQIKVEGHTDNVPIGPTIDSRMTKGQVSVARNGNLYLSGRVLTESVPGIYVCRFSVWNSLDDRQAYVSPQRVSLAGRRQILSVSATRIVGLTVENGSLLWEYPWSTHNGINVAQPVVVSENGVFVSAG